MKINKLVGLGLIFTVSVGLLTGCGNRVEKQPVDINAEDKKYSIVCTTFPQYDWMKEIIGDQEEAFDLTLLLDNSVDLHSYQPTAEDIAKISSADMFVYVGGASDNWVEHALEEKVNKDMKVVNLLEALGDEAKEEEMVEGMQESEHHHEESHHDHKTEDHQDEEHHHDGHQNETHPDGTEEVHQDEEHRHEEAVEYDEHIWLSIKNASALVEVLADTLEEVDAEHAEIYEANKEAYQEKLVALDQQYVEAVNEANTKTILFGDRFPFRYLTEDYGLDYYAAFMGCSADTEASFETVTFLASKIDELGLDSILVLEGSNQKIAETIKQSTKEKNQEILVMNSIQSVSSKDIQDGFTYLQAMEENLKVLKKAIQ